MSKLNDVQVEILSYDELSRAQTNDLDRIIFDLNSQIDLLSRQADKLDYLMAIGSGLLCGLLDVLWVGEFSLERGRDRASHQVNDFVVKMAKLRGYSKDDIEGSVRFLEKDFPIPSDGNTADLGGGRQHHLRDFAHHPTLVGLAFSLLTQFTYKSYGTDTQGSFLIVDVPERSRVFIGEDAPSKILYGTLVWFFHLVSDMAGSSSSAGKSGGTGIPGPLLSLAKELSALPIFKEMRIGDHSLSVFLSKLFNGTLLAKRDEEGKIIQDTALQFDLRGELGLALEIGRQALPVVANECIVRCFYLVRRLAFDMRERDVRSLSDMKRVEWDRVKPASNPTIARMLTVAAGVFATVDISEAMLSQRYWVSVNFIGVGRFAVAIGEDVSWCLKARDIQNLKHMYEDIRRFAYTRTDERIYERIGRTMDADKLGLTVEQVEILYNLEYFKTLNDIRTTRSPINNAGTKRLKLDWLEEWKRYISAGFPSFVGIEGIEMHWYTEQELIQRVEANEPNGTWFRLVLLEAMLFEPYYPLGVEQDKKGRDVPSKKYNDLKKPLTRYSKGNGDAFLDLLFTGEYYAKGYIARLRKCYDSVLWELNESLKAILKSVGVAAGVTIAALATAGAFAPTIAVALVGTNFAGLHGAALTSACLAYLGGGAIAAGGAGMAGGTIAIVGGGAILGLTTGTVAGGAVGVVSLLGKKTTLLESAKLLVSVREIFLNDEYDIVYSDSVYEQYVQSIMDIEKSLVELKLQADVASGKEKKELKAKIKNAEEAVDVMKIARKSLLKFKSSFAVGVKANSDEA